MNSKQTTSRRSRCATGGLVFAALFPYRSTDSPAQQGVSEATPTQGLLNVIKLVKTEVARSNRFSGLSG